MMLWLNGALIPAEAARIDPADRGFTLGDGVFETIRAEAGAPRHLPRHLARLRQGLALLGLSLPAMDVAAALGTVLAANDLAEGVLRLTVSRGVMARGVLPQGEARPTVLIAASPLPPALPPARVVVAHLTRRNEHSPLSRIKSLNYLDNILARQEAAARGGDEALLLNTAGRVAEASASNLFLWLEGRLFTPPIAEGALPGIARGLILERGEAAERPLALADLARAEGAFLANSLGLRALASIDGRPIPPPPRALDAFRP